LITRLVLTAPPYDDKTHERQAAVDRAVDAIRGKFGSIAIRRGHRSSLPKGE
jgi:hypothetical protein